MKRYLIFTSLFAALFAASCSNPTVEPSEVIFMGDNKQELSEQNDGITLTPRDTLSQSQESEIILTRAAELLSDEAATALYMKSCTADQTEFPLTKEECQCRLDHALANLSGVMFDLEVAIQAEQSDLAGTLRNVLKDQNIEYKQIIGETRGAGYDVCLKNQLKFDE